MSHFASHELVTDESSPTQDGGWVAYLGHPVDSDLLVLLRVALGVSVFVWAKGFLAAGTCEAVFLNARFQFKYAGFEWVQLWPGDGIYYHFIAAAVAGLCLAAGAATRLAAAISSLSIAYVLLVERQIYVNHYYLIACACGLLVFLPSGRRWSLDALLLARWGNANLASTIPRWQLWLIRFQLGLPYVFGGIAKLNSDWLAGQPCQMMLSNRAHFDLVGPVLQWPGMVSMFVYGGLVYDLLVVPLALWRPTRWLAVLLSLSFHLTNAALLQIGVFPWFMLATLLVFFPPGTVTRLMARWRGSSFRMDGLGTESRSRASQWGLWLAAVYVVVQLLLPLRHWALPGNPSWNERGHRFAWRMMLRNKRSLVHYLIRNPNDPEQFVFIPSSVILTPYQVQRSERYPECIRQAAIEAGRVGEELGMSDCEVHALALVSLNGRRPVPMVDPGVDLLKVKRGIWSNDWITPDAGPFAESV
ncbi:MAG: HTTM domain-containing protein, partial [Planctomycetota bacterium]